MVSSGGEDDTMALRAALTLVDQWDSDLSSLFELTSDSDGSQHQNIKHAATTAPYKPRRRARKLELAALRAEVEALQYRLALEKTLSALGPNRSIESAALSLEWERLAAGQKKERIASELENAKLRKLAQSQHKKAQQLLTLVKRMNKRQYALTGPPPPPSFDHYHAPHIDHVNQLDRLDAMARRAVGIFSTGAFAPGGRECFREVLLRPHTKAGDGVNLEYLAAWMLPFDLERVAHALWIQTVRPMPKQNAVAYLDVYEDSRTLVSKFLESPSSNEWGSAQGQSASRRLPADTDDGSIVIVVTTTARAYVDTQWKGSADVEGWLRIQPAGTPGESLSGPISRVQWYRRTLLQPPEETGLSSVDSRNWTHAVITGPARSRFEQDLDWSVQALDNLLVTPRVVEL